MIQERPPTNNLHREVPRYRTRTFLTSNKCTKKGWQPPRAWQDPVTWHPRGRNIVADHLANYTMDYGESWGKCLEWPFIGTSLAECNFVAHSDGGTRASACSASAWIVEVGVIQGGRWIYRPLAMGGTYFSEPISSFLAEALGLEECTLFLRRAIEQQYVCNEPRGKRVRNQ